MSATSYLFAAYPLVSLPLFTLFLSNRFIRFSGLEIAGVSKSGRMPWPLFLAVLALFGVDDIGTSIGLQATETPRLMFEGNPYMTHLWEALKEMKLANTDTAAMRLYWVWNLSWLCVAQLFGWMRTNYFQGMMVLFGAFKTFAGYQWWKLKPNPYTVTDFLTFKDGRPTPERRSDQARLTFNQQQVGANRRRMTEGVPGDLMNLVYMLFPFL